VLNKSGFVYGKPPKTTELEPEEKENRVTYCKNMLKRKGEPITETFFSDEMGISLREAHNIYAWMAPRKQVKIAKPAKNVRVNCWGAISRRGTTSLEIFKKPKKTDGYREMVEEHIEEMEDLFPEGFFFQQDNLSTHQAAEPDLKRQGLDIMEFPAYSPDLSPIENLWGTLKGRVACDLSRTQTKLENSLQRHWRELTEEESLGPYFDDLKTRYKKCIEMKGERLPC